MNAEFDLDNIFTYHPASPEQAAKYETIRAAGKAFAQVVIDNTPPSPDQSTAIRQIREAVYTANAAIALNGRLYK